MEEVSRNPQGQYHGSLQKTGDRLLESRSSRATLNITHCWVTEQTECKRATHHRWKQPAWAGKEIQKSAAQVKVRSRYPQQMHGHKMHGHTMHGSTVVGSTRTIAFFRGRVGDFSPVFPRQLYVLLQKLAFGESSSFWGKTASLHQHDLQNQG